MNAQTIKALADVRRELIHAGQAFEYALVNKSPSINEAACHLQEAAERYRLKAIRVKQLYDDEKRR